MQLGMGLGLIAQRRLALATYLVETVFPSKALGLVVGAANQYFLTDVANDFVIDESQPWVGVDFSGDSTAILQGIANDARFAPAGDYTVYIWFRTAAASPDGGLINYQTTGSNSTVTWNLQITGGRAIFKMWDVNDALIKQCTGITLLTSTTYLLRGSYDDSGNQIKMRLRRVGGSWEADVTKTLVTSRTGGFLGIGNGAGQPLASNNGIVGSSMCLQGYLATSAEDDLVFNSGVPKLYADVIDTAGITAAFKAAVIAGEAFDMVALPVVWDVVLAEIEFWAGREYYFVNAERRLEVLGGKPSTYDDGISVSDKSGVPPPRLAGRAQLLSFPKGTPTAMHAGPSSALDIITLRDGVKKIDEVLSAMVPTAVGIGAEIEGTRPVELIFINLNPGGLIYAQRGAGADPVLIWAGRVGSVSDLYANFSTLIGGTQIGRVLFQDLAEPFSDESFWAEEEATITAEDTWEMPSPAVWVTLILDLTADTVLRFHEVDGSNMVSVFLNADGELVVGVTVGGTDFFDILGAAGTLANGEGISIILSHEYLEITGTSGGLFGAVYLDEINPTILNEATLRVSEGDATVFKVMPLVLTGADLTEFGRIAMVSDAPDLVNCLAYFDFKEPLHGPLQLLNKASNIHYALGASYVPSTATPAWANDPDTRHVGALLDGTSDMFTRQGNYVEIFGDHCIIWAALHETGVTATTQGIITRGFSDKLTVTVSGGNATVEVRYTLNPLFFPATPYTLDLVNIFLLRRVGTTGTLFLNGVEVGQVAVETTNFDIFEIGTVGQSQEWFDGYMMNLAVYTGTLSDAQCVAYNAATKARIMQVHGLKNGDFN